MSVIQVELEDGETIKIVSNPTDKRQTFSRLTEDLVVGIVDDPDQQRVCIWKDHQGIYLLLGEVVFSRRENGSVSWESHPLPFM